jgi:hypothetical protein
MVAATVLLRRTGRAWLVAFVGFAGVLVWWFSLTPSHDRIWADEYSRLPWAEIRGNEVTLHEVRAFDYPESGAEVPRWETRTFDLDQIEGMDLAVNFWGSPWSALPIVIFRFNDVPPAALAIETRREKRETYSALAGFYRQYELIVLAGSERDLLGVRTVHRPSEDVYLYATTLSPERARGRLLDYLQTINGLSQRPRWYNAVTSNCTTAIRGMHQSPLLPLDYRLLINGQGDEMLYERGILQTDGLDFAELKQRARINAAAQEAYRTDEFSDKIRANRPGFLPAPTQAPSPPLRDSDAP